MLYNHWTNQTDRSKRKENTQSLIIQPISLGLVRLTTLYEMTSLRVGEDTEKLDLNRQSFIKVCHD